MKNNPKNTYFSIFHEFTLRNCKKETKIEPFFVKNFKIISSMYVPFLLANRALVHNVLLKKPELKKYAHKFWQQ